MTFSLSKKWIIVLVLFQISLITAAFTGGILVERFLLFPQAKFSLVNEAHMILKNHSLFELPPSPKLEYGMIRGMIATLNDPNTNFFEPPQHELQSQQLAGQYGGIGVEIRISSDGGFLLYPYPDSPARSAGLMDGDRLISVDGWEVIAGATVDEVEAALRGEQGKRVTVVILREPDHQIRTYEIRRENIPLPSITWNLMHENEEVGIVRVNLIASTTSEEILRAVNDLKNRGASALILDLRNNGGGLVDAGVEIARLFLKSGTILEQQYRNQAVKSFQVEKAGELSDIPMVVLVNENTASAAEIVAGSLQSQNRSLLIGNPTYGKNTIQLVFELRDKSSLHVTSARWWIPNSIHINENGQIEPDIVIPDDDIHSTGIYLEAIKVLER